MKFKYVFVIPAMSLFLASCGNGEETNSTESGEDKGTTEVTTDDVTHTVIDEEDENEYTFIPPSPLQVASIFKKAGLSYDAALPNNVENLVNYSDKYTQSVNFGVYSSDLAYCVKNEQYDEAGVYLKTLKDLSAKIGLETVFADENLVDRFNANVGNQDSIVDILIYVQENTDDYIAQNGKNDLAVIYYAGAWVEGMYFGANSALLMDDKTELGALISEQMTIARSIVKGLEHVEDANVDVEDLAASISDLITMFDNFESVAALGEDAAYLDIYLTDEEVVEISDAIIELRTGLTE